MQKPHAFPVWTSSFHLAQAARDYVWACLAGGSHTLQQYFPVLVPAAAQDLAKTFIFRLAPSGQAGWDGEERSLQASWEYESIPN